MKPYFLNKKHEVLHEKNNKNDISIIKISVTDSCKKA